MSVTRKIVMRLKFKAERYVELGLDATALAEVLAMQGILAEAAKISWRRANPDRKNLPSHYAQSLEFWMRPAESGSLVAPIEVRKRPANGQQDIWDEGIEDVLRGAKLLAEGYNAVARDNPLPDDYPKEMIPLAARFGERLEDDDIVEIVTDDVSPVEYSKAVQRKIVAAQEAAHTSTHEVVGRVLMADVKQKRFQLWPVDGRGIPIKFPEEFETLVLEALREHETTMLRVCGEARVSPSGQVECFESVNSIRIAGDEFDDSAPDIGDAIAAIWSEVPKDELSKLPRDAARNLDHYLYGSPKRQE